MIVHSQRIAEDGSRKRRAHKKSRQGCRNCKLRRVKCDETKPKCKKCTAFGVSCNYDPKIPDLQMSLNRTAGIKSPQKPPCPANQTFLRRVQVPASLYPVIISDNSTFQFDRQSLDRLGRFQTRTAFSIGPTRATNLYQNLIINSAGSHPYLMHAVQALTAIHDRYLFESPSSRRSITEVYHWSRAAALFNQRLSTPIQPHDYDALWATAVILGIIAFSSIEESKPEEAWPLKHPEPSDLEWLRMCNGKVVIGRVINPLRSGSIFNPLAAEVKIDHLSSAATKPEIEPIWPAFIQLYDLDNPSMIDDNPYRAAVHALALLLRIECDQPNIARFLSFVNHIQPDFKRLLEQRDPRALLLMAYWYAKACHSIWWIKRRAVLECQATCLYLERYHSGETVILELLRFPKMQCGLCVTD
ncbi:MAG: hypothetical protein M1834_004530 [Cirrosporium novae-zelandiae]|nr:MAG: hypothetical protein M1834_004530 [Cirrosporium novae-zelandiae]